MKILGSICARGGSKGVKNKNIRDVGGRPLIAYTLAQARATGLFSALAVSSDSTEILSAAEAYGATHLVERPPELATDQSAKIPAIQHCMLEVEKRLGFECEIIVDLDATSPLRCVEDIKGAVALLLKEQASNVITATHARRSPYFNLIERDENGAPFVCKTLQNSLARRQDSPACFDMNASIYVWRREALLTQTSLFTKSTRVFLMPEERSWDIDSEFDFEIVSHLLKQRSDLEFASL